MEPVDRWELTLVRATQESGTTVTFAFEPHPALPFLAGQWLHLACEANPSDRSMVRHMSIASAPQDPWVEFTMDVGSGTLFKKTLGSLTPGAKVAAFKLRGDFTVDPKSTDPVAFVAGGLGITPIRSILRDLGAQGSTVPRHLFHVARGHHLFEQELAPLPFPQIRTNRTGWEHQRQAWVSSLPGGTRFYVCGSVRFIDGVLADLEGLGVPPDRIKTEDFH